MPEDPTDESLSAADRQQTMAGHERILETVGDPICTLDMDGQFGYVNAAFERETGYDAEQVRGEPLTLVMDNDDAQTLLATAKELQARSDAARTVDVTLRPQEGDGVPVECHLTRDSDDSASQPVVVAIRDISARKAREERLSEFATVVSHDLRNPLDVALGRAEVLPEIADVDEGTEQHLDEIYNSLKRMEQLIQDVLTLSRQNVEGIETEVVDLAAVARDAWRNVDTDNATLTVVETASVNAQRDRLLRLFENLFRNSVEHGDSGVTVEVGPLAETTGFYVADDGPGIDEENREQLFEGGYSTSKDGTGLGLTIVREIAHIHGWTVTVEDNREAASGARFEVTGVASAEPE